MRLSFISILLIAISTACALPVAPDDNAPGPPPAKGSLPPDNDAKAVTPAPPAPPDVNTQRPPPRRPLLYQAIRPGGPSRSNNAQGRPLAKQPTQALAEPTPPGNNKDDPQALLRQALQNWADGQNVSPAKPAIPGNNAQGRRQTNHLHPNSAEAAQLPIDKTFPGPGELQRLMEAVSTCCYFTLYELTVYFRRNDHTFIFLNQANGKYTKASTRTH